ncbi:NADP-dependent 3-hydroxy acid dehydrogenase YdfG [Friedmanniella luteola]|uniref:NADP-dependent 3-hydroxy acid dehydrogenase YdfG n=1 Tax=Friedmanniella luteola TaxID=546871 RepID=A0A1H1ZS29_9ACTN|nr:SDR family NAD(P)-dependent oxidoreductase [Friedmanniella luteola]SDT36463.1 NADP-dependent 3-hydroxy acid dehydrogenase YdfG [Friedmanniella luteola]
MSTRRRALLVGATSQIGHGLAVELASLGHDLVLWGRRAAELQAAAAQCRAEGAEVRTLAVDVADDAALGDAVRGLADRPLHVAVWTPGLFDWGSAAGADPAAWRRLMDVNVTAPAVFTALVAPLLVAAAPSSLVYLGSGAGHQAYPDNAAYVASKHGLTGLARATFLDLRDAAVKVSLISPGLVAAGGGLLSPAGQQRPQDLLAVADVAAALRFVLTSSPSCCPTEIQLQPLRSPVG